MVAAGYPLVNFLHLGLYLFFVSLQYCSTYSVLLSDDVLAVEG